MQPGKIYCISGKVNSADKLYLVLEHSKEDRHYYATPVWNCEESCWINRL